MEEETVPTLEQVYKDFRGRRSGLLKALTQEVDDFVNQCDPAKQNLCLYGFPDESWEVKLPVEEVPPELPEPVVGINFSRDGMDHQDWLSLVAVHSDAWLLAVAFFFGAKFDKGERKKLFGLITDLPTLYDVVIGRVPANKEKANVQNTATKGKTSSAGKVRAGEVQQKVTRPPPLPPQEEDESDEDDEDEHENALCGKCGENYAANEFWICCDSCEQWFHGKCVKVTPAKAQTMKHYKCPGCSNKKPRT